ncbi:DinB family protein [Virgibacillus kekensis]|uniref:DinB family protein n=1 Tax=Virgibacillus kekensis TaxID=202261 RepID=A0ABV9DKL6_9BACI
MNKYKEEILQHQVKSLDFVNSLLVLSEEEWRTPIEKGKWTIAEIVGHFQFWDEFIVHKRLPYLFSITELPKVPDSDKINAESAELSRAEVKHKTIKRFITARERLCEVITEIPDKDWERKFTIGTTTLSLYDYLNGLAEHDRHHFNQIERVIMEVK